MERVQALIASYPDFPQKGIIFRDIHPIFSHPEEREILINELVNRYKNKGITVITGMESRGYYLALPLAMALKLPFVPLRKAGKLPGEVFGIEYGLEYGKAKLEVQKGAIRPGDKVLIVDDLLATGGTASAACNLVQQCGGEVVEVGFIIELKDLNGRLLAPSGVQYFSLFQY